MYPSYEEDAYYKRGLIFARQGNFSRAISDLNKAITINPNNTSAYINRGAFYAQQGNFTQALSDFSKAIQLNPGYKEVYFNRAVLFCQLKEYDKAWHDVHKAEGMGGKLNPGFISALKAASGRDN
jgi:Flp pilus assembly protein TadD